MFRVDGFTSDRPVSLIWDDGRLSGDPIAIDAFLRRVRELDRRQVGPGGEGPFTYRAAEHLASGISSVLILSDEWHTVIFDPRYSGKIPARGDNPLCQ